MNKRNFLKLSSAMMTGCMIPGRFIPANLSGPVYRKLGKTGISLPIVSSGIIPQDNPNLIKAIFESGIKYFDSAWDYQNGRNDTMVGEMVRKLGRDNFVVSTKVLLPTDDKTGQFTKEATTQAFMEQLDVSLNRMGIDGVDILYLHKPPTRSALFNQEMMKGLQLAKEQGKARFVGFSNHSNQVELIDAAIESKFYEVVLVGYNFRQDNIVKPAIARAHEAHLGVVAMKVFAGEYLDKERNKPVNKAAALKWVLQDEHVTTSILTMRTYQDLQTNLQVMADLTLTDQEKSDLADACRSHGLYCLGCEECRHQCPHNLPIPDLMRAFMYTYGYRDAAKARKVLNYLDLPDSPCNDCAECQVNCTMNFNVEARIKDIIRLKQVPLDFLS
jgi:predicted aldo/keto reductase-like oxidoreductase